ncbi:MAG: hypothetical protein KIT14_19480 [bacterium]|nr:hypothetical protein [bacterium]
MDDWVTGDGSPALVLHVEDCVPSAALSTRIDQLTRRAGAVYRRFAELDCGDAELHELWMALALDDDARVAAAPSRNGHGGSVAIDGLEASVLETARRLAAAERLGVHDHRDRRLGAALGIELARLELMRRRDDAEQRDGIHVRALADLAVKRSQNRGVRLAAALLLTRRTLRGSLPR